MDVNLKRNWTREELILAFNLYCKIPFTKINATNRSVRELAPLLQRSDSALALKLANFARLDPALQARNISGMKNGSKAEAEIWNEFNNDWDELAWQSEKILARIKNVSIEDAIEFQLNDQIIEGKEREALVRVRVNQSFFRKTILASYNGVCCITGISNSELLVASHIVPWSVNENCRMNPGNGLCLNALHDKAFDKGLITITPEFQIKISSKFLKDLKEPSSILFLPYKDRYITLPQKFYPVREFLEYHNNEIFRGV